MDYVRQKAKLMAQRKIGRKIEKGVKLEKLLLRVQRTGTRAKDYQALPPRQ